MLQKLPCAPCDRTFREERNHLAAWLCLSPHCSAVYGEDLEEGRELPHPPCSLHLAPLCYHIYEFLKDHMWAQHNTKNEAVQEAVFCHLRTAETEFCCKGIFILLERWQKCIERVGYFVESWIRGHLMAAYCLHFVQDKLHFCKVLCG